MLPPLSLEAPVLVDHWLYLLMIVCIKSSGSNSCFKTLAVAIPVGRNWSYDFGKDPRIIAEKSDSPRTLPRLTSSSCKVHMLSKCTYILLFSVQHVSCNFFWSLMVIIWDHFSKSVLRVFQASFTLGLPFIFRYKELGIVDVICWKMIACSCKYKFTSLVCQHIGVGWRVCISILSVI